MVELTLSIVLGAAFIDSINPCAIGVILFLSSVLLKASADKRTLLKLGFVYIATVYVVYTLSGLGLIWFQAALIGSGYAEILGVLVGSLVIALGLIELKDVFWYGRGLSLEISARNKARLIDKTQQLSLPGIIGLGGFVAMVELPCTGGPYLAITAILANTFDAGAFAYLLLYNMIFVLPLVGVLLLIYLGVSTLTLKRWRQANRKWMNLATGLLLITLGTLIIVHYRYSLLL